MKTKYLTAAAVLFLLTIGSFVNAQDNLLYGTWRFDSPGEAGNFYIGFYPNGLFYARFYEGIAYGEFSTRGNNLILDGSFEYVDRENYYQSFDYDLSIDTLRISGSDGRQTLSRMSFYSSPTTECRGGLRNQLSVGLFGQVTYTDGTPTRMRSGPGTDYNVIQSMEEGKSFVVVDGPICDGDKTWWMINTLYDNEVGWATEGVDYYFIEPDPHMPSGISDPDYVDVEDIMTDAGARAYDPGDYPYVDELDRAISKLPSADALTDFSSLVLFVTDIPDVGKVDMICAAFSVSSLAGGDNGKLNEVVCVLYDFGKGVIVGNPISATAFLMAEIAAHPDIYIDWWLDDLHSFTNSMPLTRLYCYITGTDCSDVFGR